MIPTFSEIYLTELIDTDFYSDPNTTPAITGVNSRGDNENAIQWNITNPQSPEVVLDPVADPATHKVISYDLHGFLLF